MNKRPLAVTLIAWLYIATGTIGFVYHLKELAPQQPFQYDILWISLVRLIAIVAGVCMLRGSNWARWLALLWIASHVILSAFHSWPELAIHSVLCAVFAYFLFRLGADEYFHARATQAT